MIIDKGVQYMANLTRKFVENYIDTVNKNSKSKIKLDKNNVGEYEVYFNNSRLFVGTLRESYILIQGLSYGMGAKSYIAIPSQKEDEMTGLEYLEKRVLEKKSLLVEAKKTAVDTYYSQGKLKYTINIEKVRSGTVSFTAEVKRYANNDTPIYGSLMIPLNTVKIGQLETIDVIAKRMLKSIDISIQRMAKATKDLHYDYILWIDKDVMWYLGWSNDAMITKGVDIKVI